MEGRGRAAARLFERRRDAAWRILRHDETAEELTRKARHTGDPGGKAMRAHVRLLAACVTLLAGLPANVASAKDRITVVMSSFDLLFWPTLAAKELGYF